MTIKYCTSLYCTVLYLVTSMKVIIKKDNSKLLHDANLRGNPISSFPSFGNYRHHILIRDNMSQPDALRDVSSTRAPDQRVLEALLQRAVDVVADVFDGRVAPHDQGLVEVGLFSFSVVGSWMVS